MDDRHLWDSGFARLESLYLGLPVEKKTRLAELLARYRQIKEALAGVITEIDASSVCHQCAGQCCLNGKYRINVLDSLAFVTRQLQPSSNFVQKPVCPYGNLDGCSMEPGLRPADCILFICEALDEKLSPDSRMILADGEQELRRCLEQAACLTGEQLHSPLLLWAERHQETNQKV